jgi:hypothetical protein
VWRSTPRAESFPRIEGREEPLELEQLSIYTLMSSSDASICGSQRLRLDLTPNGGTTERDWFHATRIVASTLAENIARVLHQLRPRRFPKSVMNDRTNI